MNDEYRLNSEMIRAYLAEGDRKQSHLVKELDVSGGLVAKMLCEGHVPKEDTLEQLARLLRCSANDLLIPKARAG